MDLAQFKATLNESDPPPEIAPEIAPLLHALWLTAKGDWHGAHALAQGVAGPDGCWVHAYLHRVEGDLANAGYWYVRAAKPASSCSLDEEWNEIATAILEQSDA
ncbi:MAG: hypothetical protein HOH04_16645 [Rhodospirillaceae bacterium]|jgi:hypothetical protein|nr:hypothetical protein [Rhodospirillaceae bacterium]